MQTDILETEVDTRLPSWTLQDIWNEKLHVNDTEFKPRNYIRASEIGGAFLDRYYKMQGETPTNPFDDRILRVFEAGRIFEWVVEKVFKQAGILAEAQTELKIPANTLQLEVVGHFDHKVGGNKEWGSARERVKAEEFPEWLEEMAFKLIDNLEQKYPNGLREIIAEIKSINSMSFWAHKKRNVATGRFNGYIHHKLQLLSYLIADSKDEGKLIYVSKDDLTLEEVPIFVTKQLQDLWIDDVRTMTKYYNTKTVPPTEDYITFNEEKKLFEPNWRVGRSSYLTKITGFATQEEFEASVHQEVLDRNRPLRKKKKEEAASAD